MKTMFDPYIDCLNHVSISDELCPTKKTEYCMIFYGHDGGGGWVVERCWVSFQCRGVLQFGL